ncbi:MAG: MFS transporter [Chloroflexi bacterium]|nr:MFS transporter [Chloroflexota bacterium]
MATATDPRARRARVGVSALFLVNGMLMANVIPRMPAIKDALDLTNAGVGAALAAMPIGGLVAGAAAGSLVHRFGSGLVTTWTGVAYAIALAAVGLAPSWLGLALVFATLGALDAVMDAAMNTHGIAVQGRYGRSILHAFHGLWSGGTLAGAATGAVAAGLGVPVALHLAIVGGALAVACLAASRLLLPEPRDETPVTLGAGAGLAGRGARVVGLLRLLLPIALIGILGVMLEDAAQTWNTLYLADVLGAQAGLAAVGYLVYTATLTGGRLVNDRLIDRWGNTTIARAGGLAAASGLGLVMLASPGDSVPLAALGFGVVGLGAAPLFPVMIAAAASRPGISSAHAVGIVSWLARLGFAIAPVLVGAAADAWGLGAAFAIPLAAGLLVALTAPRLLRSRGALAAR